MQEDNQFASDAQLELFRRWTNCPNDFGNTPPGNANRAYQTLFADHVHVEAHKLLSYMRGDMKMPVKDFCAIQSVYMCEFSSDHDAVRKK